MKFKFEKLIIWQKAMDFGEAIFQITETYPKSEIFNLTSQSRRAADSIALNIAEGSIGQTNLEQKKYMGYSIRSLAEVVTCLYKAKRRKYIDDSQFNKLYEDAYNLMNMMVSFKENIK